MAKSRIYKRTRNGVTRYYGDFRDYADVGGRREALIAGGTSAATTNPALAETLMLRRLRAVEGCAPEACRNRSGEGIRPEPVNASETLLGIN